MCGITVLIQEKGHPIDVGQFRRFNDLLVHRGPDEGGVWMDKNIALGNRRLSIIDLDFGHQPMTNEDTSLIITFNGEIYNFKELKKKLLPYHKFKTDSDTEVVLHLFEDHGEETPKLLDGMFAFAIYNRVTRTLFVARDHLGIKPFYYTDQKGLFIGASEPRSIVAHPAIKKNLDPSSLLLLLLLEQVPSPFSIWRGIHKLPPGSFLKYKDGHLAVSRYWQPTFEPKLKFDPPAGGLDLLDQLDQFLTSAVSRSLVADVPVGAFLSGGVDSSMICALIKKSRRRLHTFSIGFTERSYDESYYSNLVASHLGTVHHHHTFAKRDVLETIPVMASHMDEPFADYSLLPSFLLAKYTRKYVKVALSGDGGDEIFGGYPTNWAHQFFPLWDALPPFSKNFAKRAAEVIFPFSYSNFSLRFISDKFTSGHSNPYLREILWPGAFTPTELASLSSNLGNLSDLSNLDSWLFSTLVAPLLPAGGGSRLFDQLSLVRLRYYLGDQNLTKVDRASMAFSLEVRPPYLSLPLVEFVTKLPPASLSSFLKTKVLFKKVAARYLPTEVVYRFKKGFGVPIALWLNSSLNSLMHELLNATSLRKQGLFESKFVQRLVEDHEQRKRNNYKKLWTLMTFQLWYDHWLK